VQICLCSTSQTEVAKTKLGSSLTREQYTYGHSFLETDTCCSPCAAVELQAFKIIKAFNRSSRIPQHLYFLKQCSAQIRDLPL